jgi:teichuronic acid biosynthesis glycosyltransferase TuaH
MITKSMAHQFIKNRDIVLFSFQPWDTEIGSNFKDMALELAKYNRVLFVNRALDRSYYRKFKNDPKVITRLQSIGQGIGELREIFPNLWIHNPRTLLESINGIPIHTLHDWLNKINNRRLAKEINKIIAQLQFNNVILINDNDFIRGYYLKEMIDCENYIFYIRDFMMGVDFFQRHGARHEAGLMKKADVIVANSAYLADYSKKNNPNSFDIGQGCDLKQFLVSDLPKPSDLQSISHYIVGYVGNISAIRIDPEVIKHIATQLPECQVVLVGPVDKEFPTTELQQIKNIHFLGARQPDALASYVEHFDICINPQILNKVTIGNYPRKVDEYLAMGKPVVATATAAMDMFKEYTWLCNSKEDYVTHIRYLLQHPAEINGKDIKIKRKEFAISHSWENSIGLLGDAYFKVNKFLAVAKNDGNSTFTNKTSKPSL